MMSKTTSDFYVGILAALAVVAVHDAETIFREIIATTDELELIKIARRDGAMRWSGLSRYGYGNIKEKSDDKKTP